MNKCIPEMHFQKVSGKTFPKLAEQKKTVGKMKKVQQILSFIRKIDVYNHTYISPYYCYTLTLNWAKM